MSNDTAPTAPTAPTGPLLRELNPLEYFELTLGIVSLVGSMLIVSSFLVLKELRRHPFSLVFFLSICDFVFVLVITLKTSLNDSMCFTPHGDGGFCVATFVLHFFGMASVSWGAMMSIKLIINTLRPFASTTVYEKWFHIYVWLVSLATALISWFRQDGSIDSDRCYKNPEEQERVHAEFFVPLIAYFFISFGAFIFALVRMRILAQASNYRNKVLFRMVAYVIAIPVCWLGPLIYRAFLFFTSGFDSHRSADVCEGLNAWKNISLSLLGLVNAIIWLSTPDFLQALQTRMKTCCRADDGEDEPLILGEPRHDVNQMNIVLRNNMLTCTLLGIRESLRRLVNKRRRPDANPPDGPSQSLPTAAPSRHSSASGSTLTDLYSVSPINPLFKSTEGIVIDMRSGAEESESDIETFVAVDHSAEPLGSANLSFNLRRGHYFEKDKFKLDPHKGEKVKDVVLFSSHFGFVSYAPKVFHNIRVLNSITIEDYMETMAPISFLNKVLESEKFAEGGRSGSFFVRSPCRRFIVKTIPGEESDALLKILPWYYEHLNKNPKSLLVRIYGLYQISVLHNTLHVMVMSNLFSSTKYEPHDIFDLKGSYIDRKAGSNATVKKDQDLVNKIRLEPAKRQAFLKQLGEDVKLLRDLNIMDYSLLLGIHYHDHTPPTQSTKSIRRSRKASTRSPSVSEPSTDAASSSPRNSPKIQVNKPEDDAPLDPSRLDIMVSSDGKEIYSACVIDILQLYNASKKRERLFKVCCLRKNPDGISAVPPVHYCRRFRGAMSYICI